MNVKVYDIEPELLGELPQYQLFILASEKTRAQNIYMVVLGNEPQKNITVLKLGTDKLYDMSYKQEVNKVKITGIEVCLMG